MTHLCHVGHGAEAVDDVVVVGVVLVRMGIPKVALKIGVGNRVAAQGALSPWMFEF